MSANLAEEKAILRKQIRKRMREVDPAVRSAIDQRICRQVMTLPQYKAAKTIFCYVGVDWEIDTTKLISDALQHGKQVALPLCTAPGIMEARLIQSTADLQPGAYNIPEPRPSCALCPADAIEFAAVPCVSCDRTCLRLGQGGGFYDRFLEDSSFYTAALCREEALLEQVPAEPWDRPVDCVVTESHLYFQRFQSRSC